MKKRKHLSKKRLSYSTSVKRRLTVAKQQIPIQAHWIDWFAERGNMEMSTKQRKVVDKLQRRVARLETHLARKRSSL